MSKQLIGNCYYTNMNDEAAFSIETDLKSPDRLFGREGEDLQAYSWQDSVYLTLDFNEEIIKCEAVSLVQRSSSYSYKTIELYGSNDGTNWTLLLAEDRTQWREFEANIFFLPTMAEYLQYKMVLKNKLVPGNQCFVRGFELLKRDKETLLIDFRKKESIPSSFTGNQADGARHVIFTEDGSLKVTDLLGGVKDIIVPPVDITTICDSETSLSSTYSSQKIDSLINSVKVGDYLSDVQNIEDSPVGTIIEVIGSKAPSHYLPCNNQILNKNKYSYLYNYFLTQFGSANVFGGDGTTTFALPSLNGNLEEEKVFYTHRMDSESDTDLTLSCSSRIGNLYNIVNEDELTVSSAVGDISPWFAFSFNKIVNLNTYSISAGEDNFPSSWILQGKKGTSWIDLDTQTEQNFSVNEKKSFSFTNSNFCSEYRVIFTLESINSCVTIKKVELGKTFLGSSNKMKCIKFEPTFYMNVNPMEEKILLLENNVLQSGSEITLLKSIQGIESLLFTVSTQEDTPRTIVAKDEIMTPIILSEGVCSVPHYIEGRVRGEVVFSIEYWFKDETTIYIKEVKTNSLIRGITLGQLEGIEKTYGAHKEAKGMEVESLFSGAVGVNPNVSYPYFDNRKLSDYSFVVIVCSIHVRNGGYGNDTGTIIEVKNFLEEGETERTVAVGTSRSSYVYNLGIILRENDFIIENAYTSLAAWDQQVVRSIVGIK